MTGKKTEPKKTKRKLWPVSPEWRQAVREALARHDPPWNQSDLADAVGTTHVTISNLLGDSADKSESSELVPAISSILGLPPPSPGLSPQMARLVDAAGRLTSDGLDHLIKTAEMLEQKGIPRKG